MSARTIAVMVGVLLALVMGWAMWPGGEGARTIEPVPSGRDDVVHETADLVGDENAGQGQANAAGPDGDGRAQASTRMMDVRVEVWRPRHLNLVPVEHGQVTARRVRDMELLRWDFEDGVCTERLPEETYKILLVKINDVMVDVEDYGLEYLKPDQTEVRLVLEAEPGFLLRAVDAGSGRDLDDVWVVTVGRTSRRAPGRVDLMAEVNEGEMFGEAFRGRAQYADRADMIFPCLPMSRSTQRWDALASGASPFWVNTEHEGSIWVGSPGRGWTRPIRYEELVDGFEERHAEMHAAGSIDVVLAGAIPKGGVILKLVHSDTMTMLAEQYDRGEDLLRIEDVPAGEYHLVCESQQPPWVAEHQTEGPAITYLTGQQGEAGMRVPVSVHAQGRVRVRLDWDEVGRTIGSMHATLRYLESGVGYQSLRVTRLEDEHPFHYSRAIEMHSIRSQDDVNEHLLKLNDVPAGDYMLRLLPLGWQTTVRVETGVIRTVELDVEPPARMLVEIKEPEGQQAATVYLLRWGYVGEAKHIGYAFASLGSPSTIRPAAFPIWIDIEPQTMKEGEGAFATGGPDYATPWTHLVQRVQVDEAIPGNEVLVITMPPRDE